MNQITSQRRCLSERHFLLSKSVSEVNLTNSIFNVWLFILLPPLLHHTL